MAEACDKQRQNWPKLIFIGTVTSLLLTLFFFEPLFSWGHYPHTQEGMRYPVLLSHFQHALADGVWYPRWMPDLYGGYGYPTFIFYQPFFFYTATGVAWVFGLTNPLACHVTTGLLLFLGTLGAFLLGYQLGLKKIVSGVWCACLFAMTPYLVVDFNVRGALSEFSAMVLTPWPLYATTKFHEAIKQEGLLSRFVWTFVFSTAIIIYAHPATALLFFPLVMLLHGVFIMNVHEPSKRALVLKMVALQGLMALAISSFYWWPVLQLRNQVNLEAATQGFYDPMGHLVDPNLLFGVKWMWGDSPHDLPVQLGLLHFFLACSGLWLCRKENLYRVLGGGYIAGIFLMFRNPVSEWFWSLPTLFQKVQFPWRLLSVVALTQTILAVRLVGNGRPWVRTAIVFFALVLLQTDMRQISPESKRNEDHTYDAIAARVDQDYEMSLTHGKRYAFMNEFMPLGAEPHLRPRKNGPLLESAYGDVLFVNGHTKHHVRADITHATSGMVRLNQLYLAGWKVFVDGEAVPEPELKKAVSPQGLIQFQVPVGRHHIEAFYDGPPDHEFRATLTFALLLFGLWFFRRFDGFVKRAH